MRFLKSYNILFYHVCHLIVQDFPHHPFRHRYFLSEENAVQDESGACRVREENGIPAFVE